MRGDKLCHDMVMTTGTINLDGTIVSVPRERTLSDGLEQVEDQARRSIVFLQPNAMPACGCVLEYQIARLDRGRDLTLRFASLNKLMHVHVPLEAIRRMAGLRLTKPQP